MPRVLAGVAVAALAAAMLAPARADDTPAWLTKLTAWIAAVDAHVAGKPDAAARQVSGWTYSDVERLLPYLQGFIGLLPGPNGEREPAARFDRTIKKEDIERLRQFAEREAPKRTRNALLMRAAMLHGDVMLLGLADETRVVSLERARQDAGAMGRVVAYAADGQHLGYATAPPHWDFARILLDRVFQTPETAEFVPLWYRATAAFLLQNSRWGAAQAHLDHARRTLAANAGVPFDSGCLFEAYAAPQVRTVLESAGPGQSAPLTGIGSVEQNLRMAEGFFARAAELAPQWVEARVRHARVNGLLGRREAAATALRALQTASPEPVIQYYAALFLGDLEHALGNRDAAAAAFGRAAALYPRAQSPHLGLSLLAIDSGDRQQALFAMDQVLTLPRDERVRIDPWWEYHHGSGRVAGELIAALQRTAAAEMVR